MASLCYVPRAASSSFPCGGLIAGSLEGGCFWEQVNETTYRPHMLPLETGGCTDIQVETESRHCLVTYRPGEILTGYTLTLIEYPAVVCLCVYVRTVAHFLIKPQNLCPRALKSPLNVV